MKTLKETKDFISSNLKIDFNYYQNDNYLGLVLEKKNDLLTLIKFLKNDEQLLFEQLIDITAIDYPSRKPRFDVVYIILSLVLNQRILIKIPIGQDEVLESISSIHRSSNWYERECYDLFGIKFINHPDLRRIMTDYNFEGHPLRKDFPLTGHNEVHYDELEKKVVYDKVKLSQEYRDFDYSSPWEGIENQLIGDEKAKKDN